MFELYLLVLSLYLNYTNPRGKNFRSVLQKKKLHCV